MKKLIIINGTPGAGKTSVCRELHQNLDKSAWLDGDWCWMMNPFEVNSENKKMVQDNINYLLTNFINNSNIEIVVFNWVIPHENLMNSIIDKLKSDNLNVIKITLVSTEAVLRERLVKEGRTADRINDSVNRMGAYFNMNTIKLDTSQLSIAQTVEHIKEIING